MNQSEKTKIKELREKGLGYTEIAKSMNISKNTVKSFCRRNGLGKLKKIETNSAVCEFCGKPISQPIGRKQKRFCSDNCRNQ